jgi:hypothetical protein
MENLSTENLVNIALELLGDGEATFTKNNGIGQKVSKIECYKILILEMLEYKIYFSEVFDGWNGIDSKLSMICIYFAQAHHSGKKLFKSSNINNKKVDKFLERVYELYSKICFSIGLKFVPMIPNGLEKIVKKTTG